jgi:hypothetical protein
MGIRMKRGAHWDKSKISVLAGPWEEMCSNSATIMKKELLHDNRSCLFGFFVSVPSGTLFTKM